MRKTCVILAVGFITLVMSGAYSDGVAADYPTRPVEIVCPNAPGGGMDFVLTLFKLDMACSATTAFVGPGRLRLLVVASDHRLEGYPDVPALKELGYPIYGQVYYSLWGPKNLPEEVVVTVSDAIETILLLNNKELKKSFQEQHDFSKKFLAEYK